MKVVHVFWGLSFGGIETMLVNIANAQAALGAEIGIIIINDLYEKTLLEAFDKRINIYFLHRKIHSHNPWFAVKLNMILRRIKPDVIHLHGSQFYRLIIGCKLSRAACVTLHDLPTGSVRREGFIHQLFPLLDFNAPGNVTAIDKFTKVFAISQAVKEALWNKYGIKSNVINNGILTTNFKQKKSYTQPHTLKIVQVSRLEHDKKGQDILMFAATKLKGSIEIDFIGNGSSMDYLKRLSKELGIEEFVHFLGEKTQTYITEHLCKYNLFVQASRWEGFGLTVAEAMAAGVPVLVSTNQGPAEITQGNRYGWLFENGNADSLAQQISYIHTHYYMAADKAQAALEHVKRNYDVSITAKKYLDLY